MGMRFKVRNVLRRAPLDLIGTRPVVVNGDVSYM
jgi:hypothetical protein